MNVFKGRKKIKAADKFRTCHRPVKKLRKRWSVWFVEALAAWFIFSSAGFYGGFFFSFFLLNITLLLKKIRLYEYI